MIDVSQIKISTERGPYDLIEVRGRLALSQTITLDPAAPHPNWKMNMAIRQVRERIWHRVYGDLIPIIEELKLAAVRSNNTELAYRVTELSNRLSFMLAPPFEVPEKGS